MGKIEHEGECRKIDNRSDVERGAHAIMKALSKSHTVVAMVRSQLPCFTIEAIQWNSVGLTGYHRDVRSSLFETVNITDALVRDITTGELLYNGNK